MNSSDLTSFQAALLREQVRGHLAYLARLRKRMEMRGFVPSDPLYQAAARAYAAVFELHLRLHYETCETGVGRPARQP